MNALPPAPEDVRKQPQALAEPPPVPQTPVEQALPALPQKESALHELMRGFGASFYPPY